MRTKKINVNSLSALQAMKFWLLRERHRHEQDIDAINQDLIKLHNIKVPMTLDLDAFYEVHTGTAPESVGPFPAPGKGE
jgi:hypothetical protein